MAKSIAQLLIEIGADTAAFRTEMEAVKRINRETADVVKTAWATVSDVAQLAGIGLGVRELVDQFNQVIESAHQLELQSQKLGVGVEQYQKLALAFKEGGVDAGELQGLIRKLSQEISAAEAGNRGAVQNFKDLGIQWQDLATGKGRPVVDVLLELADRFSVASDGANKNAWAIQMLGRAGLDAIPTLNKGSAAIKEYGEYADKLGAILGKDMVDRMAAVREQQELLNASWAATKARLVDDTIPAIQQFTRELIIALNTYGSWRKALMQSGANIMEGAWETLTGRDTSAPADVVKQIQDRIDQVSAQAAREAAASRGGLHEGQAAAYAIRIKDLMDELRYWQAMAESDKAIVEARTVKATAGIGSLGMWDPRAPKTDVPWGSGDLPGIKSGDLRERKTDLDRLIESLQKEYTVASQGTEEWQQQALAVAASNDKDKDKYATAQRLIEQLAKWNEMTQYATDLAEGDALAEQELERTRQQFIKVQEYSLKNAQEEIRLRAQTIVGYQEQRAIERQLLELQMKEELEKITSALKDNAEAVAAATTEWKKNHDTVMRTFDDQTARAKTWAQGWDDAFKRYRDSAQDNSAHAAQVFQDMTTGMSDALVNFVRTGKLDFSNLANSIIADLIRIQVEKQIVGIFGGASGGFGAGGLLGSIADFFTGSGTVAAGAAVPVGVFASGGDVLGGSPSIVGEKGPELFIPSNSGRIVSNAQTRQLMGSVTVINSPIINIDSRTDQGVIAGIVDTAMQASEGRIYESMRRRGSFSAR